MLMIRETFINRTLEHRTSDTHEWVEAFTDKRGRLFRTLQREYGRCTGNMYIDTQAGDTVAVGWVFSKRVKCCDCDDTCIREVWVEVRDGETHKRTQAVMAAMNAERDLKHALENLPDDLRQTVNLGRLEEVLDEETTAVAEAWSHVAAA